MKLTTTLTTLVSLASLTAATKPSSSRTTTGITGTASPAAKAPPIPEDFNLTLTDRIGCVTAQIRTGGVSSKVLGRRIVDVASAGAPSGCRTALPGPGPDRDFTGLFNDGFESSAGQVRLHAGNGNGHENMKRAKLSISFKSGGDAEEGNEDERSTSASSKPTAKAKSGAGFAKDFNIGLLMVGLAGVGAGFMAA